MTRVFLVCAVAVNSSTIGEEILREELKKRGINGVQLEKATIQNTNAWLPRADVIVSFVQFTAKTDKPVISGVPMVTGGKKQREAVVEQILAHVPEAQKG